MSRPNAWCDRCLIISSHYIGLCLTPKAFRRELKRLGVPRGRWPDFLGSEYADGTTHYFSRKDKLCAIVCLQVGKKTTPIEICGLLIHEAVHIWQANCDVLGERHPSSEFEAYSIQMIAHNLIDKYSELKGLQ